ncbi:pantetheine-phosphate adenylyltransferase [candidate division KSB1 bacterium]
MKIAIYPGTFDPITNGHIDIIERALIIFDKVIVAISVDSPKKPLFTVDERMDMIKEAAKYNSKVEVDSFNGLLVKYARKVNATAIIRGLRAVSDFEYEFQMALMNRRLNEKIETVFLMPNEKYTYLNSSLIKEISSLGGDVTDFVPENVKIKLTNKQILHKDNT